VYDVTAKKVYQSVDELCIGPAAWEVSNGVHYSSVGSPNKDRRDRNFAMISIVECILIQIVVKRLFHVERQSIDTSPDASVTGKRLPRFDSFIVSFHANN